MTRICKIVAALALTAGAVGLGAQPAAAAPPSAASLCGYIARTEIADVDNGGTVLFAKYETLTSVYVEARCLHGWQTANVTMVCGFYARFYSNGARSGPYQATCV